MQIANDTMAMIIASLIRLGMRLNDGPCGGRNPRPIVSTILTL